MPITDSISPVKADDIGRPVGTYRVELLDRHTGRVKERQDVSNYISPLLLQRMRWLQMMQFHTNSRYAHLGTAQEEFPRDVYPHIPLAAAPTLPHEFIAGLSSDLAEDPASSWGTGQVIGYASRYKTTVAAGGSRGQINEAQSEMTIDGSKVVFDFNEDQGNGAINSLAICRLSRGLFSYDVPSLSCRSGAAGRREGMDSALIDPNYVQILGFEPDMNTMYSFDGTAMTVLEWDMATNAAAVDDMGYVDQSAISLSDITYTSPALSGLAWYSSTGSSLNYNYYTSSPALVRDGNTYYVAHGDRSGDLVVGSWNRTTGAQNWNNEYLNSGSTFVNGIYGLTLLGGKLYAVVSTNAAATTGAAYGIQRIDPTTGAAEAVLPFGTDSQGNTILSHGGVATDGTHLYATTSHGILKMTTAGAIVESYGQPYGLSWTETGLTPWSTNASYQQVIDPSGERDYFGMIQTSSSANYDSYRADGPDVTNGFGLLHIDNVGKLWVRPGYSSGVGNTPYLRALDGANVFSRSVLDTTVNKTNSSTMKWTYEITFPSEWRLPTAHILPPA